MEEFQIMTEEMMTKEYHLFWNSSEINGSYHNYEWMRSLGSRLTVNFSVGKIRWLPPKATDQAQYYK